MLVQHWTSDDGLISNYINSVKQTSDGFIWLTSFNGLHRFDGKDFKHYTKNNVQGLISSAFYGFEEDRFGTIWIATQGSGLWKFQNDNLTKFKPFTAASARSVYFDSKDRLWVGTNGAEIYYIEKDSLHVIENNIITHEIVNSFVEGSKGNIWIATASDKLFKYSDKLELVENDIITGYIGRLRVKGDSLFIASSSGLYVKYGESIVKCPNLDGYEINDVLFENDTSYLLATEQGLVRYFIHTKSKDVLDQSHGLPTNQISGIAYDHEGSLWLATRRSGLIRLYTGSIQSLGVSDGLEDPNIVSIAEHDGRVYLGSNDGSLSITDKERDRIVKTIKLTTFDQKVSIRDMVFEKDKILMASYAGLIEYSDGKEKIYTEKDGLTGNSIRRILKHKGSYWLASRSGGVMEWKDGKVLRVYDDSNYLKSNYVLSIEEDKNGDLVVGTHSGGINIIRDNEIKHFTPDSLAGILIFNNYIDDDNNYWLATNLGIMHFDGKDFTTIKIDADIPNESYFDIVPDVKGYFWLSCGTGLVRVEAEKMKSFLKGETTSVKGIVFDESDGMRNKECTGATSSLRTLDGSIWVPTLGGAAIIPPSKAKRNEIAPKVAINEFAVDGNILRDNLIIAPGAFRFKFNYSSLSFLAPEKIRYKYKLSNVDPDWILTPNNEIEYTNLGPGDYKFEITATNNDGVWSKEVASISFTIEPFFYQTGYFYFSLALLAVLLTWAIVKIRTYSISKSNRELIKVNKELDRFVYSASHDLRAPLASILGLVQIGKHESKLEEKDNCLDMIDKSVNKLDAFIREIIDYSKNQRTEIEKVKIEVEPFIQSIVDDLRFAETFKNIEVQIISNESSCLVDKNRLKVILTNLIGNAFKYVDSEKGIIKVEVKVKKSGCKISVEDNGEGIEPEHLDKIFDMFYRADVNSTGSGLGLYIVKETIEKLQGEIEVKSTLGQGTNFTFTIPK